MNHNPMISLRQMLTLLFLALFPLGTQRLFSRLADAGGAAWLCPLAAGVLVLLAVLLVGGRTLGDPLAFSKTTPRKFWSGFFWLWALFLTAAQAARVGSRLGDSLGASPLVMTAAVLLLAGWMAWGGLPALARAGEIFILAVGGGFALIFFSGIFRLEWGNLLLWTGEDLTRVPGGTLAALGTLAVGCWALLFVKDVTGEEGARPRMLRRLGTLFLLLSAAMVLVLGRFGPALTARIHRPFFQMVSGLGFEGAFQRLEGLVSALWLLGDASLLALLLLALGRLTARVLGQGETKEQVWAMTALVFLLSLPLPFWNLVLEGNILPWGNLAAGGLLVAFSLRNGKNEKSRKKVEKRG